MANQQTIGAAVFGGIALLAIGIFIGVQIHHEPEPKVVTMTAEPAAPLAPSRAAAPGSIPTTATVAMVPPKDVATPPATPQPTIADMKALGERVARGDATAMTELQNTRNVLYQDIDFQNDRPRVIANLKLMKAAFDVIGQEAAKNNPAALQALQVAAADESLRSFAPDALGIAAAAGNEEALDMLLHHERWHILLSSAVFALKVPAANNNEKAIDFLIEVLDNENNRPLWNAASQEILPASVKGNTKAKAALDRFEANGGLKRETR